MVDEKLQLTCVWLKHHANGERAQIENIGFGLYNCINKEDEDAHMFKLTNDACEVEVVASSPLFTYVLRNEDESG